MTASVQDLLTQMPDWLEGLVFLAGAAVAALIVHRVALGVLARAAGEATTFASLLLARTRNLTRWAAVLLAMYLATHARLLPPSAAVALSQILWVGFITLLAWAASVVIDIGTDQHLRRFEMNSEDNLLARKHHTQTTVLRRTSKVVIVILAVSAALMTFPSVRQYGISLFASAGVAGLVVGFAARPILANLIAGVQLAITQPIRIDDAVVVEGEWGWIEEITSTYVVIRLWDLRRLVVPLLYFLEQPFQNWTRTSASLIGSVFVYTDYTVPVERIRQKLEEIAKSSPLWDGKVVNLQVSDAREHVMELRALVSAATSPQTWDLRCYVREHLIAFLQAEMPESLPRQRVELTRDTSP